MNFKFFGKRGREIESLREELAQIKAAVSSSDVIRGSEVFNAFAYGTSSAGKEVTEYSAMAVSAVFACVQLIAGAIAGLPMPIYRRNGAEREKVDHELFWLLNEQPLPLLSSAVFWEYITGSIMLHGDGFAEIIRATPYSPNIAGFEPFHPLTVTVRRHGDRLKYLIAATPERPIKVIDQDDMLHIPGVGFNGFRGMSPLRYSIRSSVGIAIAADEYSGNFFANGARPDFALKSPGVVTKEQTDLLRETWASRHKGSSNAHLPAVLTGGMDVAQLNMSAEDTQLIETRRFEIEEIARAYGVPPHMIGHTDKSTSWGTGIEQMGIGFVKYSLRPHLNRIENEINRKCFRTDNKTKGKFFAEFNVDGLMEGDSKAQAEYFGRALGGPGAQGWMTVNEVRKLKNFPPIPGGDELVRITDNKGPANAATNPTTN